MPFNTVMVRRQDGLAKQWTTTKIINGHFTKPGVRVRFEPVYSLKALDGSTNTLVVCEKMDVDVKETLPFTRQLPGMMRHKLFFGDLLFVVRSGQGSYEPFTVEDLKQIFDGDHPVWSVRGIRDVSQQREVFDDVNEVSSEDDDDDDDDDDDVIPEEDEDDEDNPLVEDEDHPEDDDDDEDDD